jgi:hypothetical protein
MKAKAKTKQLEFALPASAQNPVVQSENLSVLFAPWALSLILALVACAIFKRLRKHPKHRFLEFVSVFSAVGTVSLLILLKAARWWQCRADLEAYGACQFDAFNFVGYLFIVPAFLPLVIVTFLVVYFLWLRKPPAALKGSLNP